MKQKIIILVTVAIFTAFLGTGSVWGQLNSGTYAVVHYYPGWNGTSDWWGAIGGEAAGNNGIYCNFGFTPTQVVYGKVTGTGENEVGTKYYTYYLTSNSNIYRVNVQDNGWDQSTIKIWATNGSSTCTIYITSLKCHPQITSPASSQSYPYTICAGQQVSVTVNRNSNYVGTVKYAYVSSYDDSNDTYNYGYTIAANSSNEINSYYYFTPTQGPYVKIIAQGYYGDWSKPICIKVNEAPTTPNSISGSTSVCAGGGSQSYSISAVSNATSYTWTLPSGWSGSSSGTSISATPGSNAQSGNISVTANNSCGNSTARSLFVTVSTVPSQPGAISGSTSICTGGGTQTYSISAVSGATSYTWTLPSGWSGNSTGTSISATPGTNAQSGNISVTANNNCGNSTARTLSVTVNSVPSQPGTISGATSVCAGGGTQTYSISAVSGATSYTWTLPSGWSGNSTGTSISATPGTNAQSGNISVTANNNCGNSTAHTLSVTVNSVPSQPGTISGTTSVCAGSTETYCISPMSGVSYTWTLPSGWSVSGNATDNCISVTPGSGAQSGNISVTANNNCGSSAARTLSVTVNSVPSQPGTISGPSSVEAGTGAQTYSISTVSGATSYTWTLPNGWSGSSTGTSISATPTSNAQSGYFRVTANNSCGNSSEQTLYVTVINIPIPPSQPGAISGATSVCAESGAQTYSISSVSEATSYTWTLPSGWSGSSTGTSISAYPNANAQSGNISVTANNSGGSSQARTLSVTVSTAPSQPGTISGSSSVEAGSGAQTYSISTVSGATSYTWTLPSGWSGNSTGTSISATPTSSAQSGNISVTANNSCGSSSVRTLSVTVNPIPTAPSQPGTISGATSVCAGGGAQTYSISAVSNATNYTWSLPNGWSGNSTTTSISATPGSNAQSGNISVTANNNNGSSSARTLSVNTSTPPTAPTSISGTTSINSGQSTTLTATGGSTGSGCTYQWYSGSCGSGNILGTGQSITVTPTSNTTYYVRRVGTSPCNTTTECAMQSVTVNSVSTCSVEPLLKTTWYQNAPYNNLCPIMVVNGQRALTGCVATAMAQIMMYWAKEKGYPIKRIGNPPAYSYSYSYIENYVTKYQFVSIPALTSTPTYEWNNMLNSYIGSDATNAVAKLMYDCGVSVKMQYTHIGSGATSIDPDRRNISALSAFPAYFGFDDNIDFAYQDNYNPTDWNNLLRSELDAGRPVYYRGVDPNPNGGGHAFVCDGYDNCDGHANKGKFHFNWGWNGSGDGYFETSALNVKGYTFKDSRGIIFKIEPRQDGDFSYPTEADGANTFVIYANEGNGGTLIPSEFTFVYRGANQPYTFDANSDYEIDQVLIDNVQNAEAKANGYYIFSNVTANHTIKVTFKSSILGIKDISPQGISIYPNPAHTDLFIKTDLQIKTVEICDISGRNVKTLHALPLQNGLRKISVSSLLQGIYIVKVYTDKGVVVSKMVKE